MIPLVGHSDGPGCLLHEPRIGRLAFDHSVQVKQVGSALLREALQRAIGLSTEIGTCAVLVDALSEHYGFVAVNGLPSSLVLPVSTIAHTHELRVGHSFRVMDYQQ